MKYFRNPGARVEREQGNVLVVSFLLVTLLTALATAHFATVQKNSRHSNFVIEAGDLRKHAESGIHMALHEMIFDVGSADGKIGTELWTTAQDLGRDGVPSTGDEGEGDGVPTPGEPNLVACAVGEADDGMRLLVHCADSAWPNVKRVVSTSYSRDSLAVVEVYVRVSPTTLPRVGAVFMQPQVVLDLNGNNFTINGNDINPDGTAGPEPAIYGIGTLTGDPPGSNSSEVMNQIPSGREDQVIGLGGVPSVGESSALDFDTVFNMLKASRTNVVAPGTYASVTWGNYLLGDNPVTYCNGDLTLSGVGSGSGVLVVEGSLTITGGFDFIGVVIVRGDVRLTGGGTGIHIYGGLLIGETLSAIDPDLEVGMTGTADIQYSSVGLNMVNGLIGHNYDVVYWNYLR